jgi:phosphoribosylglycinamide formyltransferase 1
MKRPAQVVILTGDEPRHQYFRRKMALDHRIEVLASYCEGTEQSLANRTAGDPASSDLQRLHIQARTQAEHDFFGTAIKTMPVHSGEKLITKGGVNLPSVVADIKRLCPTLLICYGASLIGPDLISAFEGRFLNVHLGLSPYYRGSGTNVWPLINKEPGMVGATFMHLDKGIDTGRIIHQIRADIFLGDSPHSIGNRLIARMTDIYCDVIAKFDDLSDEVQPPSAGRLYLQKHFDNQACQTLYQNFSDGMIEDYLTTNQRSVLPYIVSNKGLDCR